MKPLPKAIVALLVALGVSQMVTIHLLLLENNSLNRLALISMREDRQVERKPFRPHHRLACLVEQAPNPQVRVVHLRKKIADEIITNDGLRFSEDPLPPMLVELQKIDGVVYISLDDYDVQIGKAEMFTWDELQTPILDVIASTMPEAPYKRPEWPERKTSGSGYKRNFLCPLPKPSAEPGT